MSCWYKKSKINCGRDKFHILLELEQINTSDDITQMETYIFFELKVVNWFLFQ